jgi:hypothetical protein
MTQLFAIDPLSAGIEYPPGALRETRMPILKRRLELVQDSGRLAGGHDAPHGSAVIMFPGPTGSCSSGSGPT